jgi:cob(I)alamin adenosyltransferase
MRIYTRHGDDGSTGLFGGQRVGKDSLRVEAYGTLDEANSAIGFAAAACGDEAMRAILLELQSRLFDAGANLCTPTPPGEAPPGSIPRFTDEHIQQMERWIDEAWAPLEPMKQFILPGGSELACRLHVARCVARRAERLAVALGRSEAVDPRIVVWLNRLSDLLFALARRANQLAGVADVPWTK